jgi:hypothetical protein
MDTLTSLLTGSCDYQGRRVQAPTCPNVQWTEADSVEPGGGACLGQVPSWVPHPLIFKGADFLLGRLLPLGPSMAISPYTLPVSSNQILCATRPFGAGSHKAVEPSG